MSVLIATDGTVQQVSVVGGHPLLVNAALDAIRQWLYSPQTMPTRVEVDLPFQLPPQEPENQNPR